MPGNVRQREAGWRRQLWHFSQIFQKQGSACFTRAQIKFLEQHFKILINQKYSFSNSIIWKHFSHCYFVFSMEIPKCGRNIPVQFIFAKNEAFSNPVTIFRLQRLFLCFVCLFPDWYSHIHIYEITICRIANMHREPCHQEQEASHHTQN